MIDQLAKQIFNDINEKVAGFSESNSASASQIRAVIDSALRKLNLVTREEFDAQTVVLLRTREKLDTLEAKLAALEKSNSKEE